MFYRTIHRKLKSKQHEPHKKVKKFLKEACFSLLAVDVSIGYFKTFLNMLFHLFSLVSNFVIIRTLSHNVVSSTPRHEWGSNVTTLVVIGTDCTSNYHTITTTTAHMTKRKRTNKSNNVLQNNTQKTQVCGFLQVLQFPSSIKLTATI
jgi:hypothetical protein